MKYLLLTLPLLCLVGCQDAATTDKGYTAGYDLTCGYAWSPGNEFVIDKEFAYNFLTGARKCAQEHPELARKVLGFADADQTASENEADTRMESLAEEESEQQEVQAPAARAVRAPVKAVKAPAKAKAPVTTRAPTKAKAPAKRKTPTKTTTAAKPKAPTKAKAPAKPKPPARAEAPVKAKPPAKAQASAPAKAPEKAAGAPPIVERRAVSRPTRRAPPVAAKPRPRTRPKKAPNSYELFMGQ